MFHICDQICLLIVRVSVDTNMGRRHILYNNCTILLVQGAVCVSQVITGVGKHSINGRPKILPAVVRYLSDAGYRFTETLGNSGVLEVIIGGHRRPLD